MARYPIKPLRRTRAAVQPSLSSDQQYHLLLLARGQPGHRWTTIDALAVQLRIDHLTLAAALLECAASGLLRSTNAPSRRRLSLTRAGRRRLDQLEQCRQTEILALQNQLPLSPRIACEGALPHTQSPGEGFMPKQRPVTQLQRTVRPATLEDSWLKSPHHRESASAALSRLLWAWLSLSAMPQPMEARIDDTTARRRTRGNIAKQRVER